MEKARDDFKKLANEFSALKHLLATSEKYLTAEVCKRLEIICKQLQEIAGTLGSEEAE